MKDSIKIFLEGEINPTRIYLNGKFLSPKRSQGVMNHSPDGFAWGYSGSGPAQLALAICLVTIWDDYKEIQTNEDGISYKQARIKYQLFKEDHIAGLPEGPFKTNIQFNPNKYIE